MRVAGPQLTILIVVPAHRPRRSGGCSTAPRSARRSRRRPRTPTSPASSGISPKAVSTVGVGASPVASPPCRWPSSPASRARRRTSTTSARAPSSGPWPPRSSPGWCRSRGRSWPASSSASSQAVISFNFLDQPGLMDFLVLIAVLVAVYWQSRQAGGETQTFSFGAEGQAHPRAAAPGLVGPPDRPDRPRPPRRRRRDPAAGRHPAVAAPAVHHDPRRSPSARLSLTVLTGWAGQLSLGQMAFAGVGALLTAAFTRGHQRRHRLARHPRPEGGHRAAALRPVGRASRC